MSLVILTSQFRRSFKKILKSGRYTRKEVEDVVEMIARGETLDLKYRDHWLHGELLNERGCHIHPDLILVYRIENNNLVLTLIDIGSHSDLF